MELYEYAKTRIEKTICQGERFKYSDLTINDKLYLITQLSMTILEDWSSGQCKWRMTDQWYNMAIRLIKDCGFDISPIKNVNMKNYKYHKYVLNQFLINLSRKIDELSPKGADHPVRCLEQILDS